MANKISKAIRIVIKVIVIVIAALTLLLPFASCIYVHIDDYLSSDLRKVSFLYPTKNYPAIDNIDVRILEYDKVCQIRYFTNYFAKEDEKFESIRKIRDFISDYLKNNPDDYLNTENYKIYVIFEIMGQTETGFSFSNYDPVSQKTTGADFGTISLRCNVSCIKYFENVQVLNIAPSDGYDKNFDMGVFQKYNDTKYVIFEDEYIYDETDKSDFNAFEIRVYNALSAYSPECLFYYSDYYKLQDTSNYKRFLAYSFIFGFNNAVYGTY